MKNILGVIKDFYKDLFEEFPLVSWGCVLLLGFLLIYSIFSSYNDHCYTATITDKERVNDTDSSCYLIYTELENEEVLVLENTDNLFRWKVDSSDIYGELKVGATYEFTVVGFRVPFLSLYENIISYELVKERDTVPSSDVDTEDNSYIIADLNEKINQGFTLKMIVNGNEFVASDTFVFTEDTLDKYSIAVDYNNKIIILTEKD